MKKKGQAAMEFLMTYGWAILAAIIAIAALAWFGVFSPGRFTPETCSLSPPLGCDEFVITDVAAGSDTIQVMITNGAGDQIDVSSIAIDGCTTDPTGWADVPAGTIVGGAGTGVTLTCDTPADIGGVGDRFKGALSVTYTLSGKTISQTSTGSISGRLR